MFARGFFENFFFLPDMMGERYRFSRVYEISYGSSKDGLWCASSFFGVSNDPMYSGLYIIYFERLIYMVNLDFYD